jgi:hypothetical protein
MATKKLITSLNLITKPEKPKLSKLQHMRQKLLESLEEQLVMAEHMLKGSYYEVKVERKVKDPLTGERVKKTVNKLLKAWYYEIHDKMFFEVRYANRALELVKGKTAIEIESREKLLETIDVVIAAVKNGELDAVLDARNKKAT